MLSELAEISPDGHVPKTVIKDAGAARNIYSQFLTDDLPSNIERARIQGIKDRNPPFDEQALKDLGQSGRTNVSWGLAESSIEGGATPYYDIVTSVPQVATVLTDYGGPDKASEYGRILSEEFHRTMTDWDEFLYHVQLHQDQLLTFGIGPVIWRDERDWRFEAIWRRDILVASDAKASRNKLDLVFIKDWMKAHEVYRYIENPARAKATGWNVKRGKQAIMDATMNDPDRNDRNWEYWQQQFKDNNYYVSYARTKTVAIVHCLAKEFDGRISHYIFTRNPLGNDDGFIFSKVGRFSEMNQAVWLCFDGVGNADFKSVRGYGTKIAAWAEADDRFNNTFMDNAILSNTVMFQAGTAADVQRFAAVEIGSYRILPPNFNVVQFQLGAGLRDSMNVANYFRTLNNSYNASYKSPGMPERSQGNPETATEAQLKAGQRARLSSSKAEKYLNDVDRLYYETFRRMTNPNLVEAQPGAKEALEFQQRCIKRGVPKAIFERDGDKPKHIVSVKATRAIGNGSPDGRALALRTIAPMIYAKSPQKKQDVFTRDFIAAEAGTQSAADRYGPDLEEQAPGNDEWMAQQENNDFITGIDPIFSPDQKHFTHAVVHISFMAGILGDQQQEPMDPAKLVEVLDAAGAHTLQHVAFLRRDPTRRQQVGELERQLSMLMEQADALRGEAAKMEKDRADGGGGGTGLDQISERLNINYKDAPPDVQRQIEALLGLEPSTQPTLAERNQAVKERTLGIKTAKTGADIQKDRAQVALADAKTAEDIRKSRSEKSNGNGSGGSKKK